MNSSYFSKLQYVAMSALFGLMVFFAGCSLFKKDKDHIPLPASQANTCNLSASGGMVLPVNGELITLDEVITLNINDLTKIAAQGDYLDFRRKAKPLIEESIDNKISNIVLYQKAKKEAREGIEEPLDKAVDEEIRRFIAGFNGNYADAEKAIAAMGMDWKSFREYQKKMILVQVYLSDELKDKKPITYTDLKNYYEDNKKERFSTPASMQFRVIDIIPSRVESADPNQTKDAAALSLAKEILKKIETGQDFDELAKQYSHDPIRAPLGGLWNPVSVGSLATPYDALETEAIKLEPKQIAGPIVSEGHIFILKLENKQS